jgi:hypothetical protein
LRHYNEEDPDERMDAGDDEDDDEVGWCRLTVS